MQITINKKLLLKSLLFSLVITVLLMVMAYLPIWSVLTEAERMSIPIYVLMIGPIAIFCILTAVFYFDIRKILERKNSRF